MKVRRNWRAPNPEAWRKRVVDEHGGPDGMSTTDWALLRLASSDIAKITAIDAALKGQTPDELRSRVSRELLKYHGGAQARLLKTMRELEASRPKEDAATVLKDYLVQRTAEAEHGS